MIAFRTWGKLLLAALGIGLVAGAGQLGLAYGLGLVRFARSFDGAARNQWPAHLSWVSWFAMVAAITGALIAQRLAARTRLVETTGSRVGLSIAAGLGAATVAPLCMQPARAAEVPGVSPVAAAGLAAVLGAGVGVLAAIVALQWRPVAWNIATTAGAIWFLALISVMPSLGPEDPLPAVRLGVLDPAWLSAGGAQRLAVLLMPAIGLAAGAVAAGLARWRGQPTLVVATAGLAGPALLALGYLIAGPGDAADKYQAAPYWGSLVAIAAGALASVLVAVLRWPLTTTAGPSDPTGPAAIEPSDILRPIPGERHLPDPGPDPRHAGPDDGTTRASGTDPDRDTAAAPAWPPTGAALTQPPATPDRWSAPYPTPTASSGTPTAGSAVQSGATDPFARPADPFTSPADPLAQPVDPLVRPTDSGSQAADPASARLGWLDVASREAPWAGAAGRPATPLPESERATPTPYFQGQVLAAPGMSASRLDGTQPDRVRRPEVDQDEPAQTRAGLGSPGLGGADSAGTAGARTGSAGGERLSGELAAAPRTEDFWPTTPFRTAPAAPAEPPVRTGDGWDAFAEPARTEPARTRPAQDDAAQEKAAQDEAAQDEAARGETAPGGATPGAAAPARAVVGRPASDGVIPPLRSVNTRPGPVPDPGNLSGGAGDENRSDGGEDHDGSTAEAGQLASGSTGRGRRGLFRRNRSGAPDSASADTPDDATAAEQTTSAGRNSRGRGRPERPVPARDEDYVDWVSGLSGDATEDRPLVEPDAGPRRTLRSSGRHHVD